MIVLALLWQTATAAPAERPTVPPLHGGPQEMTCPIGGERFSAWRPSMYSTDGSRPDGKPYSYLSFPFPLPVCPTNKLVAFDTFNAAELTRLPALIGNAEYKRLVGTDTSYFRAYWLASKLGRPASEALGLLLSAIWEVSPAELSPQQTPEIHAQFTRYQALFIKKVRELAATTSADDRLGLQARAANAARQLGRFAEAETLRRQALDTAAGRTDKRGWDVFLAKLGAVIARKDGAVEPLDMIPDQQVAFACAERTPSSAFDRSVCARPDVAAHAAKLRRPDR